MCIKMFRFMLYFKFTDKIATRLRISSTKPQQDISVIKMLCTVVCLGFLFVHSLHFVIKH